MLSVGLDRYVVCSVLVAPFWLFRFGGSVLVAPFW